MNHTAACYGVIHRRRPAAKPKLARRQPLGLCLGKRPAQTNQPARPKPHCARRLPMAHARPNRAARRRAHHAKARCLPAPGATANLSTAAVALTARPAWAQNEEKRHGKTAEKKRKRGRKKKRKNRQPFPSSSLWAIRFRPNTVCRAARAGRPCWSKNSPPTSAPRAWSTPAFPATHARASPARKTPRSCLSVRRRGRPARLHPPQGRNASDHLAKRVGAAARAVAVIPLPVLLSFR